jgi:hypothetical protein
MSFPVEFFPEQIDSQRIYQLYSDDIDDETVQFWRRSLFNWALWRSSLVINPEEFYKDFIVNSVLPTSFEKCLNSQLLRSDILRLNELDSYQSSLNYITSFFSQSDPMKEEILYLPLLAEIDVVISCYTSSLHPFERVHYLQFSQENDGLREFLRESSRHSTNRVTPLLNSIASSHDFAHTSILLSYMRRFV